MNCGPYLDFCVCCKWYVMIVCLCEYCSGEGIPDLLLLLVQWAQKTMVEKLTYSNEIQV